MARPDADYTTLTQVRRMITPAATDTNDDDILRRKIQAASGILRGRCRRSFVPYLATLRFDAVPGVRLTPYELMLDEDLLAVTTATNGDGTTISSGNLVLRPLNAPPYHALCIKRSAGVTWAWDDDWEQAISIAGVWGYHEDYANAFADSGETISSLSTGATTFTATDADGQDADGRDRFEVGRYLRLGGTNSSEIVKVTDRNTTTQLVTIRRAQLGTSAAAIASQTTIYSYRQTPAIEEATARLAVWLYQHRDARDGMLQLLDSNITLQDNTLKDIFAVADGYIRRTVVSA